jgi:ATP-binding cassette subfamily G (WHITE) protein 2
MSRTLRPPPYPLRPQVMAETIAQIFSPIVFACAVYWLVGLQAVASKFFIFLAFMILCSLAATSLALAVSALARTTDMSVTVLPMVRTWPRVHGRWDGSDAAPSTCVLNLRVLALLPPQVLEVCRLFGGFFLSPANLPRVRHAPSS